MSQEIIRTVLDFPKPVLSKQLNSFLGLVNYFHDFVRNASTVVYPLHQLLYAVSRFQQLAEDEALNFKLGKWAQQVGLSVKWG